MKEAVREKVEVVERVLDGDNLIAVIVRHDFKSPGISFFTPNELSQQMAYIERPAGDTIKSHVHNLVERNVSYTLEALFIRKGRLRVDLYNNEQEYLSSRVVTGGDVVLLVSGGHGFEMLDDVEMIEIKQGPYSGVAERDKTQFDGVDAKDVKFED